MKSTTMQTLAPIIGFLSLAVSASEIYRTSHFPALSTVPVMPFSYNGDLGPINWFGLNKSANALCDKGKNQSPLDIHSSVVASKSDLSVTDAKGSDLDIEIPNVQSALFENIGSYVEVVVGGSLSDSGKKYKLAQFHYHTPSEHRINGEYMEMEQHFVFETADSQIAVLAFFIQLDNTVFDGPLVHQVFENVEKIATPGQSTMTGGLNFTYLLTHLKENDVWRYSGSLTSPPCTEGISWIISQQPLRMNIETYKRAKKVLRFNARYTQNLIGSTNLLEMAASELKG